MDMAEHRTLWIWLNTENYGYGLTQNTMDMAEHRTLWIWINTEHYGYG